ncbi:type II secretion system F family protein [Amycolatopsis anabasis]|uniref:type II secretion system F family protein n=1 Tax=Amycolatopsis anabasis TaxID=1840409 RepID=UPI00131B68C0|nr:type II secretion system F family protein [Amycolatopsis anabasis]
MTGAAAALIAAALLVAPEPRVARSRLARLRPPARRDPRRWPSPARAPAAWLAAGTGALTIALGGWPHGVVLAGPVAGLAWLSARWWARRRRAGGGAEALRLAATWDLLAACLRAGLPVPVAIRAVADGAGEPAASAALRSTAELLALGAGEREAWAPARDCPATAELARAAQRTTRSGTALAGVAAELAACVRDSMRDEAEARAQRAGVLIAGPLGLCFLPAFLCLGVLPVVLGLAEGLALPH